MVLSQIKGFFTGSIQGVKNPIKKANPQPSKEREYSTLSAKRNETLKSLRRVFPSYRPNLVPYNEYQKLEKDQMMAISRDMIMNEPAMRHAMRIAKNSVVGTGWTLSIMPKHEVLGISREAGEKWAKTIETFWNTFANSHECHFDASRKLTFTGLLRSAYQAFIQDGDALGVMQWRKSTNGLYSCVQLIDSSRLKTPPKLITDPTVKNGIRVNEYGEAEEYFFTNPKFLKGDTNLVPDDEFYSVKRRTDWGRPIMLHVHEQLSPEQVTGTPEYFSGAYFLKLISEYLSNENQRNAMQASIAYVIKSTEDYKDIMQGVLGKKVDADSAYGRVKEYNEIICGIRDENKEYLNELIDLTIGSERGARALHLLTGEEIEMLTKGDNINSLEGFTKVTNKLVSSATGNDYATMFNDFADMSYSAARYANALVQLNYDSHKYTLQQQFAMPLLHCFVEELVDKGIVPLPDGIDNFYLAKDFLLNGCFVSKGKPIIDPLKEAKAQTEGLTNKTLSLQDIYADRGVDWREGLEQIAREQEYAKGLGVDLSQLSQTSGVGNAVENGNP